MITTKRGDNGFTDTLSHTRVHKSSQMIWVLGNIDELNSYIGLSRTYIINEEDSQLNEDLSGIQSSLMAISAIVAGGDKVSDFDTKHLEGRISELEKYRDEKGFVKFGVNPIESSFQVARSVCRIAEASLWCLKDFRESNKDIMSYMNRLSDYLFLAGLSYKDKKPNCEEWIIMDHYRNRWSVVDLIGDVVDAAWDYIVCDDGKSNEKFDALGYFSGLLRAVYAHRLITYDQAYDLDMMIRGESEPTEKTFRDFVKKFHEAVDYSNI